jgi:hypothetical protein
MALIARILLFFALLWPCVPFAQEHDVDPCDGGPLETRSVLRCRDGDPSCDIDGVCDGTCVVRSCVIYPKNPASCLVTTRFCPRSTYASLPLSFIPVGNRRTFRVHATRVGAVCKLARRRCVAPILPPCRVDVTGDVTVSWSCRARLIAAAPDRAKPKSYLIQLSEIGGPHVLEVDVDGAGVPAPAMLTSDLPDRRVSLMRVTTESERFYVSSSANFDPLLGTSLEASLALVTVGESRTPHHEAHGSFNATAVGTGLTAGGEILRHVSLAVQAQF